MNSTEISSSKNQYQRKTGAKLFTAALLLLLCFSTGCEHVEKVTSGGDDLARKLIQDLGLEDADPNNIEKMAREEVDKLLQVEYLVEEIPFSSGGKDLEYRLKILGAERWDCFQIMPNPDGTRLRVVCKRKPKSYLRYLTRAF